MNQPPRETNHPETIELNLSIEASCRLLEELQSQQGVETNQEPRQVQCDLPKTGNHADATQSPP